MRFAIFGFVCAFGLLGSIPASAGDAVIEDVSVTKSADGTFRFDVTVRHEDTGWDHYADGWEVLSPDGVRLGYRKLAHPHVNEQPFTRSLSGVSLPPEVGQVELRVHDSVHGWNAETVSVSIP